MTHDVQEHVVHIADLHFWQIVLNPLHLLSKRFLGNLNVVVRRRREFMMQRAAEYADAVAATGVSSVILTGDFSSTSLDAEFVLAAKFVRDLRERGLTIQLIPGNHDVYTFGSVRTHQFERHFADFIPPDGYPSLTALPGGTPLILVPTVCPRLLSSRGSVTPKTLEYVRNMLDQCSGPVIVAAHYPFLHQTRGYASAWSRRLAHAEQLRGTLAQSGKQILYIAGHVHRFSYERAPRCPNLTQLTTGAFFRTETEHATQGEFTEIQRRGDEFVITRHIRKMEWETQTYTDCH